MPGSSPDELQDDATKPDKAEIAETKVDAKDASAESSPAEPQGAKGDMLSAVKAALKPKEKSPDSGSQGSKTADEPAGDAEKEGEQAEADAGDLSEDDLTQLAKLKPKTAKRIRHLTDELSRVGTELETLRPQAEQFRQMATFVADAGLSVDEVNRGFNVMRDLKRDPLKAFEAIKPIYDRLAEMVGLVLPDDLRNAVNLGQITEAHARDLARHRATATLSQQRVQTIEQQDQVRRQIEAHERHVNAVSAAVTEWEKPKAKSDPDWKLKQPRVMELIELEIARKQRIDPHYFPRTIEEAVGIADAALNKVNEEMKRFSPKPKAIVPITDVASSRGVAKPTSAVEAAKQGLARLAAG